MESNKEYRKCAFAFLDIMGYKSIVEKLDSNPDKAMKFIRQLEKLISDCINAISAYENLGVEYIIFSDSICLWVYIDEDENRKDEKYIFSYKYMERCYVAVLALCQVVVGIQQRAIDYDLLFRGAISIGRHYHTENITFSSALVKAYIAESSDSIYPRVILYSMNDDFVLTALLDSLIATGCVCECDDWAMIDYIGTIYATSFFDSTLISYNLDRHREFIINGLEQFASNEKVRKKYEWLARYFNSKLREGYKDKSIEM